MHTELSNSINHLSLLVTNESEVSKKSEKCDFSTIQAYNDDREWLYINNLHAKRIKQRNEITFFFIRKSIYIVFFDEHIQLQNAAQTQDYSIQQKIIEQQIKQQRLAKEAKQQRLIEQAKQQRIEKQQRLIEQTK